MNIKIWSIVIILIIVLAGTGVYLSKHTVEKDRAVIVAMVNDEGSGVFASNSVPGLTLDPNTSADWGGVVFATPGPSSIQHMIFMDFVTNILGLNFVQFQGERDTNTVYWMTVAPGSMGDSLLAGHIDGGIAWEAHYSNICETSKYGAYSVGKTSEIWEGHPCCVIAASRAFVTDNPNAILRFLSAYAASVVWLNEAIDVSSANHSKLVEYVKNSAGVENEIIIQEALENVFYTYSLNNLKSGIETMVDTYLRLGLLDNTLESIGFGSSAEFADWLVDESYINNAAGRTSASYSDISNINLNVGVLAYDIHQIALHVGIGEGIFSEFGLTLNTGTPFAAGGDVMSALGGGAIQIGFVGSPPVVLRTINDWEA